MGMLVLRGTAIKCLLIKQVILFRLGGKIMVQSILRGILQVQDENGKWGYVDTNGEIVLEPQWDSSSEFHDGLAAAEKDGLYGYINTTGKLIWMQYVVPEKY